MEEKVFDRLVFLLIIGLPIDVNEVADDVETAMLFVLGDDVVGDDLAIVAALEHATKVLAGIRAMVVEIFHRRFHVGIEKFAMHDDA